MKILLLTERFDDTIPTGVISKRIADELFANGNEVAVISSDLVGKKWEHGYHIICKKIHFYSRRILKFLSDFFLVNLDSALWRYMMYGASKKMIDIFKPDIVYARSTPISVCEVAARIKKTYGIKVVMHFTDPVPAPIEWDKNLNYRKRMIMTMNKILPYADLISFGNHAMLNYQQKNQSYSFKNKAFVSPDPVPQKSLYYCPEETKKDCIILAYLGAIYGSRNPQELFNAIERFNRGTQKAILIVYDNNRTNISVPSFVQFAGRVKNVNEVLLGSNILINLDGDDKEPVFISSKLKEYLCCGRPIVSITPYNSPSRLITDQLKTVLSVKNNSEAIYDALMTFSRIKFTESDFYERKGIIESFTPKKVTEDILLEFNRLLG